MLKTDQGNYTQLFIDKFFRLPTENSLIHFFRYLIAGGCAALVDWLLYYLAVVFLSFHYLLAAIISFIAATALNYYLSKVWVFVGNGRFKRITEISLVYLISAAGLLINILSLSLLIEIYAINFLWSKIIATAVVFIWNFTMRKYFVFKGVC